MKTKFLASLLIAVLFFSCARTTQSPATSEANSEANIPPPSPLHKFQFHLNPKAASKYISALLNQDQVAKCVDKLLEVRGSNLILCIDGEEKVVTESKYSQDLKNFIQHFTKHLYLLKKTKIFYVPEAQEMNAFATTYSTEKEQSMLRPT